MLVTLSGRQPLAQQVYASLRSAIAERRLRAGDRLPSTRALAAELAIARNTVVTAYERLAGEGWIESRAGTGMFVCGAVGGDAPVDERRVRLVPHSRWTSIRPFVPRSGSAAPFDFQCGVPDAHLFPTAAWRRLIGLELRTEMRRSGHYGDAIGDPRLRLAIARHVTVARFVRCEADDVVVTSGAQQAFGLVASVVAKPGDLVAVEDPGYPMARLAFEAQGLRIAPVPVDEEGLVVSALPDAARLVYVTPSHQFPLGVTLSLARRRALLAWAAERGAAIVEDDYDSEFRFAARPLEPLHRLDRHGLVVYVGSFSKVLLPALRVGYVVAPRPLRAALATAKLAADFHGNGATQGALARFIAEGRLQRQIRVATLAYRARRDVLLPALRAMPGLALLPGVAGLHVAAWLDAPGVDAAAIRDEAAAEGVQIATLGQFAETRPARDGLLLGYGSIDPTRMPEGLRRLAAIVARHARRPASRARRVEPQPAAPETR